MAVDNTPPRLKLIATIAVITVVTLISLDFVFKSYYAMMTDEAQHEKIAPTKDKDEQHKAEAAALTGASVPIDKAMGELAKGERPEAIKPNQSEDMAPMTGWSKLPKALPVPIPHDAPAMPPASASAAPGAAATAAMGDAGAMPLAGGADAGARRHGPLTPPAPAPAPAPRPAPHD